MNKSLLPVILFLLFIACSRQQVNHKRTASSTVKSYTGDWELLGINCNDLPIQYSGFRESLRLDQEQQQGFFNASGAECQVKINFSIRRSGNDLTFKSRKTKCLPQSCSITPAFSVIGKDLKQEEIFCPADIPSDASVSAELSEDFESLRIHVPLSNAEWSKCELVYIRKVADDEI